MSVVLRRAWWVVGVALVVLGGLAVHHWRRPESFGWFAYEPMPRRYADYTSSPTSWGRADHVVTGAQLVGLVAVVLGLLLLVGGGAFALGRRRAVPEPPDA